jgi:hypothetical protein
MIIKDKEKIKENEIKNNEKENEKVIKFYEKI